MGFKKLQLFFLLAASAFLVFSAASAGSIYGHISFVDNGTAVIRADGSESQAVVNLPLAPGDTVLTPANGRCELQFDNGTVIRLDQGARLRITTVLAPSLTSNRRITTLDLLQGQLYALPQSYNREVFQVVTPGAAVDLSRRTAAFIRIDAGGGTSLFSDRGKFKVLYGGEGDSLRTAMVKPGRPYAISVNGDLLAKVEKRGLDFIAWNEYVDRHFRELHHGINKVPANLTLFKNKALLNWAEKWSSLYGEWIYDDLFGYVWKPADDQFVHDERPFVHADFVRINGQLFLVPQQQWGWVPAHMGTWVWLKSGWTWIPGEWFHPGIVDFQGTSTFPTFGFYWSLCNAYWNHRQTGVFVPPGSVISLVKKVMKAPDGDERKRLAVERIVPAIDGGKLSPVPRVTTPVPDAAVKSGPLPVQRNDHAAGKPGDFGLLRDWNPDSLWAVKSGYRIQYSSSSNSVVCPQLKITSGRFRGIERMMLREAVNQPVDSQPGTMQGQPSNTPNAAAKTAMPAKVDSASHEKKDNEKK